MSSDEDDSASEAAPGLGDDDLPGFPVEGCPEELPDLSGHHSALADLLRGSPEIYSRLRGKQTALGVGLGRCIKVGMDNRGHRMIKTLGIVAGDAECYDTFSDIFDPIISRTLRWDAAKPSAPHPAADSGHGSGSSSTCPDRSGKYVISTQVRAVRNLSGFRFPPAMSRAERHEVERLLSQAIAQSSLLEGEYLPLPGSESHASRPGGMTREEAASLEADGWLFGEPDSKMRLSSGVGRHWPDGRGVFVDSRRNLAAWVNEDEHLRLALVRKDGDIELAHRELAEVLDSIASALGDDRPFARSERLGVLTSNLVHLGAAMQVTVRVRMPCLLRDWPPRWRQWCAAKRIRVNNVVSNEGEEGVLELSSVDSFGMSEAAIAASVADVLGHLVGLEEGLKAVAPSSAETLSLGVKAARLELYQVLRASLDSGALQSAIDKVSAEQGAQEEAAAITRASLAAGQAAAAKAFGERWELLRVLEQSLESGALQAAMEEVGSKVRLQDCEKVKDLSVHVPLSSVTAPEALQQLAKQSQRLSELRALIAAAKSSIAEREKACREAEEELKKARAESEDVDRHMEWHRQALQDAEKQGEELEESQRNAEASAAEGLPALQAQMSAEVARGLPVASDSFAAVPGIQSDPIAPQC